MFAPTPYAAGHQVKHFPYVSWNFANRRIVLGKEFGGHVPGDLRIGIYSGCLEYTSLHVQVTCENRRVQMPNRVQVQTLLRGDLCRRRALRAPYVTENTPERAPPLYPNIVQNRYYVDALEDQPL